MDPQAAWDQLLTACAAEDWDQMEERATDLLAWLDRGGFPPRIVDVDTDWNTALARAGCRHALEMVNGRWSITT